VNVYLKLWPGESNSERNNSRSLGNSGRWTTRWFIVSLFVQIIVVPTLAGIVLGSKALWMISMFFTGPTGAADWTAAGWVAGAAGWGVVGDGMVHPQMIAMQTIRISRKTGLLRMKNRGGSGVVILFLSRTGSRPVPGNWF
jgi:hypothetical protein